MNNIKSLEPTRRPCDQPVPAEPLVSVMTDVDRGFSPARNMRTCRNKLIKLCIEARWRDRQANGQFQHLKREKVKSVTGKTNRLAEFVGWSGARKDHSSSDIRKVTIVVQ